jgi:hypothetical protein
VARCLQVEVAGQGATIEEALANLREALESYLDDAPAPEVTDVITAPVACSERIGRAGVSATPREGARGTA